MLNVRRSVAAMFVGAGLLMSGPVLSSHAQELITNGSFEDGDRGWESVKRRSERRGGPGPDQWEVVCGRQAVDGNCALYFEAPGNGLASQIWHQTAVMEPGEHEVSVWLYNDKDVDKVRTPYNRRGRLPAFVSVDFWAVDERGKKVGKPRSLRLGDKGLKRRDGWVEYTGTLNPPETTFCKVSVYAHRAGYLPDGDGYMVDALSVYRVED